MTFDQALTALHSMVGSQVEIHIIGIAADGPIVIGTATGKLDSVLPMSSKQASDGEAVYLKLDTGGDPVGFSLDREMFDGGIVHDDDAVTIRQGNVELVIARRVSTNGGKR